MAVKEIKNVLFYCYCIFCVLVFDDELFYLLSPFTFSTSQVVYLGFVFIYLCVFLTQPFVGTIQANLHFGELM